MKSERALGKLSIVFLALVISTIVYAGYKILPIYYYHFEFQAQMGAVARISSQLSQKEIREKLSTFIKTLEMPFKFEDIKIQRQGKQVVYSVSYKEPLYIYFRDKEYKLHTFYLTAIAKGQLD